MVHRLWVTVSVGLVAACVACGGPTSNARTSPFPSSSVEPTAPSDVDPSATGGPGVGATLDVVTQIGEQCPQDPKVHDPRCDPVPRPATSFEVRTVDGAVVATGETGSDGHAIVRLVSGSYVIRGEPVPEYQFTPERRVDISNGSTTRVPLTYTNGFQ